MTRSKTDGDFGFRELESFNAALLGKMPSRTMLKPNSLWVKILKGIYFPKIDFLHVGKGSRSSWAWASMLVGRNVIKGAAVGSIRDRRTIRPFMDAWIFGKYDTRLGTHPVTQTQAQMKLEEWIDPTTKTWMEEKVSEVVTQGEAHLIFAVPIPLIARRDELR